MSLNVRSTKFSNFLRNIHPVESSEKFYCVPLARSLPVSPRRPEYFTKTWSPFAARSMGSHLPRRPTTRRRNPSDMKSVLSVTRSAVSKSGTSPVLTRGGSRYCFSRLNSSNFQSRFPFPKLSSTTQATRAGHLLDPPLLPPLLLCARASLLHNDSTTAKTNRAPSLRSMAAGGRLVVRCASAGGRSGID